MTNEVEAIYDRENDSIVRTVQTDVSSLESAVFDSDNNVKLAETTVVTGISNTVGSQGQSTSTLQTDVSLNSAVFDADNNVKLATGTALTALTNDVRAIYDSTTDDTIVGSVDLILQPNGAVFDANNNVQLASASAVCFKQRGLG